MILKSGADPNKESLDHWTPMKIACVSGNFKIIEEMLGNPKLDYEKVSREEQGIYHEIAPILMTKAGRAIYYRIAEKIGKNEKLANVVDSEGFSPLQLYVNEYGKKARQLYPTLLEGKKEAQMMQKAKKQISGKRSEKPR